MALLAHPAFRHPALARIRNTLQSRLVLGVGYEVAAGLTGLAILLTVSPPTQGPLGPTSRMILTVLGLNMALILGLVASVTLRILELLNARSHDAGARLHVRFVRLFALAAVVPALVVFVFYGVLVNQGVEKWFSERVQTVVENSATVFRSYVDEQTNYIGDHITVMAVDLNREAGGLQARPASMREYLTALASYHAFPAAYLIDSRGQVLARVESPGAPTYTMPPKAAYAAANQGDVFIINPPGSDVMRELSPARVLRRLPLCLAAAAAGDRRSPARSRGRADLLSRGRPEPEESADDLRPELGGDRATGAGRRRLAGNGGRQHDLGAGGPPRPGRRPDCRRRPQRTRRCGRRSG